MPLPPSTSDIASQEIEQGAYCGALQEEPKPPRAMFSGGLRLLAWSTRSTTVWHCLNPSEEESPLSTTSRSAPLAWGPFAPLLDVPRSSPNANLPTIIPPAGDEPRTKSCQHLL